MLPLLKTFPDVHGMRAFTRGCFTFCLRNTFLICLNGLKAKCIPFPTTLNGLFIQQEKHYMFQCLQVGWQKL